MRDRRIRVGAGTFMVGLAVLPVIIILGSAQDPRNNSLLIIVVFVQALLTLFLGAWLASGKRGTSELVPVHSRWRKAFLVLVIMAGVVFFVWQLADDPRQLLPIALWPSLVASAILVQFGPGPPSLPKPRTMGLPFVPGGRRCSFSARIHPARIDRGNQRFGRLGEISQDWQGSCGHGDAARR